MIHINTSIRSFNFTIKIYSIIITLYNTRILLNKTCVFPINGCSVLLINTIFSWFSLVDWIKFTNICTYINTISRTINITIYNNTTFTIFKLSILTYYNTSIFWIYNSININLIIYLSIIYWNWISFTIYIYWYNSNTIIYFLFISICSMNS